MSNRYNQNSSNTQVHFSKAMFGEAEHSKMIASPLHITTFNAGDIVPIYCREVLPDENLEVNLDFVIRQTTLLTPTLGQMKVDFYAFFVPNRVVNQSWKAVSGENFSGSWTANSVSLAPLRGSGFNGDVQIPVGSVADYYGFPTQQPIPNDLLRQMHDLKFRGYVMIWNEYFRDQNYQPPIPMSTLNIYQGFLDPEGSNVPVSGISGPPNDVTTTTIPDGSVGPGAVAHALYGSGAVSSGTPFGAGNANSVNRFRATMPPLKANKLHDYFTTVLPSPQKAQSSVMAPVIGLINVSPQFVQTVSTSQLTGPLPPLRWRTSTGAGVSSDGLIGVESGTLANTVFQPASFTGGQDLLHPSNLQTVGGPADVSGLSMSVDDIRMASAIQQVYETLARGGSRYRELVQSFFGIEVEDPYSDIPKLLGHASRELDLYQTAQTSSSETGNTPQGNLAAFGYTSGGCNLFSNKFIEHGYVHIFAVVRHRNIYCSMLGRDNFRLNMLDFYLPPLANISEQPVYTREINPFAPNPDNGFGYQEAWAEYRYEPDQVSGYMRPGVSGSLALWNYSDDFDSGLQIADGDWLKSNSQVVLDRSLAVTSSVSPQLKGQFLFHVTKELPMPTYSVPGMDII